jgi:hypothetical protein
MGDWNLDWSETDARDIWHDVTGFFPALKVVDDLSNYFYGNKCLFSTWLSFPNTSDSDQVDRRFDSNANACQMDGRVTVVNHLFCVNVEKNLSKLKSKVSKLSK